MNNMKISLIEFSVENFKIFKEKVSYSMLSRKSDHTFLDNKRNILKTSLVYGPNASGKSSLFEALSSIKSGIINSANNAEGSSLPYFPFLFSDGSHKPSFFEIIFNLNKRVFKYNFSILEKEIVKENLIELLSGEKERKILSRNKQDIKLLWDFKIGRASCRERV